MSERAQVRSIEALRGFRAAIWNFVEEANAAMADAEGDLQRTKLWLETEAISYWRCQHRKRQELVSQAEEKLRQKMIFVEKGQRPQIVDEQKQLQKAKLLLEESTRKLEAIKKYSRQLDREVFLYAGSVNRFASVVQADMPKAVAFLDGLVGKLEEYVALNPSAVGAGLDALVGEALATMARSEPEESAQADGREEEATPPAAGEEGA